MIKIAEQLFEDFSKLGAVLSPDSSSATLKPLIESRLRQLNLVSREEFDVQQAVLSKTREKLEQLEKHILELENKLQSK